MAAIKRKQNPGVNTHGIEGAQAVYRNLSVPILYEHVARRYEGVFSAGGALVVNTGRHTGRSANDKFIVEEPSSRDKVWWGKVNRPFPQAAFNSIHERMKAYMRGRELYVQDCLAGADPDYQVRIRVITELAWQSIFARHLFIQSKTAGSGEHPPDFTVIALPNFPADPEEERDGDTAIFFGLSGTGKTTLSADPERRLIGDDEHGWSERGVFNFEGGCYAKVIRLSPEAEPQIYACTRMFGTVLENVVIYETSRDLDLDSDAITENTRAAYPLSFIPNVVPSGIGNHPKNIIMLTCDAFGVMPPVARLSPEQAMYHFISGYTAKVAGTEKGLGKEPQATFSACFGAPFMVLHPSVYANLLREKISRHKVDCWLVNTGWSGGPYGVGSRMKIQFTRAIIHSILDGRLSAVSSKPDPVFGIYIPDACPGVPSEILTPRTTWKDGAAYDAKAKDLARRFARNFDEFSGAVRTEVKEAGPRVV